MKCPVCLNGVLRVIPMSSCPLGHPHMVCDNCRHGLLVEHGPKNAGLLPPEADLVDCGVVWNEDDLVKYGLENLPTVEEMHELIALFQGAKLNDIYGMLKLIAKELRLELLRQGDLSTQDARKLVVLDRWIAATPPGF